MKSSIVKSSDNQLEYWVKSTPKNLSNHNNLWRHQNNWKSIIMNTLVIKTIAFLAVFHSGKLVKQIVCWMERHQNIARLSLLQGKLQVIIPTKSWNFSASFLIFEMIMFFYYNLLNTIQLVQSIATCAIQRILSHHSSVVSGLTAMIRPIYKWRTAPKCTGPNIV